MNSSTRFYLGLLFSALTINSMPVSADTNRGCSLEGPYGYLFTGTSFTPTGPVPLTQTGLLSVDKSGNLSGEGSLAFQFTNFMGAGPLWLLLREVQSDGVITPDASNPCTGVVAFLSTATVIKTSNSGLVPEGTVLYAEAPKSIAYTISGQKNETVNLISTSVDTIASGVAHKQNKPKNGD